MLKRIDFELENITLEEARKLQYRLGTEVSIYRVFIDPYKKRGFVIFDEEKNMDVIKEIAHGIQIKKEEEITVEDLIKQSSG